MRWGGSDGAGDAPAEATRQAHKNRAATMVALEARIEEHLRMFMMGATSIAPSDLVSNGNRSKQMGSSRCSALFNSLKELGSPKKNPAPIAAGSRMAGRRLP